MARPTIALLTDFGLRDHYVAAMKGVILGIAPDATLVDIVHQFASVFRVGAHKVHVTGFSRGGFVTWRLLCDHADLFASAAPGGAGRRKRASGRIQPASGRGPVHAAGNAMRKVLEKHYPQLSEVRLEEFDVRLLHHGETDEDDESGFGGPVRGWPRAPIRRATPRPSRRPTRPRPHLRRRAVRHPNLVRLDRRQGRHVRLYHRGPHIGCGAHAHGKLAGSDLIGCAPVHADEIGLHRVSLGLLHLGHLHGRRGGLGLRSGARHECP